jgi:DNA-binding transcriptional LysR family regulator
MAETDVTPGWDDLRLLLEVHRRGSFLAAGEQLKLSTSTVARRIAALEAELGHPVVHRTAQGTTIEKDARNLIAIAEEFEQQLAAARRDAASGAKRSPFAGVVRISLPDGFLVGAAEAAARFCKQHPETEIELISETRYVDLSSREADLGLRAARSSSPVLIDKPIGAVLTGLFASEAYLRKRLPSRELKAGDYAAQDFVVEDVARGAGPAQWLVARGASRFPVRSNSYEARIHAAKRDMGIVMMGIGSAAQHPELHFIALDAPLPSIPFFLTMHRDLRKVPRVRGVADALHEVISGFMASQAKADVEARGQLSRPGEDALDQLQVLVDLRRVAGNAPGRGELTSGDRHVEPGAHQLDDQIAQERVGDVALDLRPADLATDRRQEERARHELAGDRRAVHRAPGRAALGAGVLDVEVLRLTEAHHDARKFSVDGGSLHVLRPGVGPGAERALLLEVLAERDERDEGEHREEDEIEGAVHRSTFRSVLPTTGSFSSSAASRSRRRAVGLLYVTRPIVMVTLGKIPLMGASGSGLRVHARASCSRLRNEMNASTKTSAANTTVIN